ncbi:GNAT family N-acetyltransferase [Streptomyces sp. NPDC051561]|uniref:GNAT family N-acetyltransferase n=1 Tax=Streptomyces sp. NPDC051561 TaxID=3365658 RepID=UPI0037B98A59
MGVHIRQATGADRDVVVGVLHKAFRTDPVSQWVFPDPGHRDQVHPHMMGAFTDLVLAAGRVDLADEGAAAALWLDTPAGAPEPDDGPAQLRAALDPYNERIELIASLTTQTHPHHEAHLYLWMIGVHPDWQGEGLGSALMTPVLERCDREGKAAYLEASSTRSRELYRRLGFADHGTPLRLPYGGPLMYPMWRAPQG